MNSNHPFLTRRCFAAWAGAIAAARLGPALANGFAEIEPQPCFAAVKRALEALANLGSPVSVADAKEIAALARQNDRPAVEAAERILDRYTLANLSITDELLQVATGGAQRQLLEQGWRMFLVRLANPAARTDYVSLNTRTGWGGTPGQMIPTPSPADSVWRSARP